MASRSGSSSIPLGSVPLRRLRCLSDVDSAKDLSGDVLPTGITTPPGDNPGASTYPKCRVLKAGSEPSVVTFKRLAEVHRAFMLPPPNDVHIPSSSKQPNTHKEGFTCLYLQYFMDGLRLPLPTMIADFLRHYDVSPGQLAPNVFRILLALLSLSHTLNLLLSILDVLYSYELKASHPTDPGRFTLVSRSARRRLVTGLPDSNRHYKEKYFFVRSSLLGFPDPSFC